MSTLPANAPPLLPVIASPDDVPPVAASARDTRRGISGVAPSDLEWWLSERGESPFRARQVAQGVWRGGALSWAEVAGLPAALRGELDDAFRLDTLVETTTRPADAGLTVKALHRLEEGPVVESVLMRYPAGATGRARATICISSQAGCAVGCPFCATGELGFSRDLSAAEIADQVRYWQRHLARDGEHVTNVVFMGMGEPLLNTDAVLGAAAALNDPRRFGLAARHITVSTSGVVPGIERLTALRPQYTLAVSLHAARPELRDVLVPLNRRWPIHDVVEAATAYASTTGRRVSYEYVMINGINDTRDDARALGALLSGRLAHVNLIPMNAVAHTAWGPSSRERLAAFAEVLRASRVPATVRQNRGAEIGAACGQLAAERVGEARSSVALRRELLERRSAAAFADRARR